MLRCAEGILLKEDVYSLVLPGKKLMHVADGFPPRLIYIQTDPVKGEKNG